MEWLRSEWFTGAVQIAQSLMLGVCGFFLLDAVRHVGRGRKIMDRQTALLKEQLDLLYYQQGIIAALQSGVVPTGALPPIDFSNLPIELRIAIWRSLVDIAIEVRQPVSQADR